MNKQDHNTETGVSIEMPVLTVDSENSTEQRLTDNAAKNILPARYLIDGESPDELFQRVAYNVAVAEAYHTDAVTGEPSLSYGDVAHVDAVNGWADEFYEKMSTLQFIPNSPTLMNAGADLQQLSACFVLEVGDSMAEPDEQGRESILDTVKHAGQIFKSGGGVGYTFSHLRPKGGYIESTDSQTSGPIAFMRLFDELCQTVKQGGKRRGAQMAIMRCDHPDIGRFATAKRNEGAFSNFNISVAVTDEFKEAVENDADYVLGDPKSQYDDVFEVVEQTAHFYNKEYADSPEAVVDENIWRDHADSIEAWDWENGETVSLQEKWEDDDRLQLAEGNEMTLPARFIWDIILDGAWRNGEPGLFYLDETNRQHSFDVEEHPEYEIHATNPCCAEGTLVNTPDGYRAVENIKEGDIISTVWGAEAVDKVLSFENQTVYEVTFSDGGVQTVTEDHRYHAIKKGSHSKEVNDIVLRDLEEGDHVRLEPTELATEGSVVDYNHGLRRGILLGDGCITENIIQSKDIAKIASSEDDVGYNENVKRLFGKSNFNKDDTSHDSKSMNMIHTDGGSLVEELSIEPGKSHEKTFDVTKVNTRMEALGILDGLLATDGNINLWSNHPHIRWDTTSDDLAQNIRRLLGLLGMHGRISTDDRDTGGEIDGRTIEKVHTCNEVAISGDSAKTYADITLLEEIHPDKASKLKEMRQTWLTTGNTWKATIESIEKVGKETVYDLYASGSDTWITGNYVQRGCAEQPLCNFEACNLGHVNLSLMLNDDSMLYDEWLEQQDHDYDKRESAVYDYMYEEAVDWEQLREVVHTGTRFLDNVVTMSDFPLDQIEETVSEMRKIGLGVMGWAQMLYQMGIRYGSHESLAAARLVMNFIDKEATHYSHELANERGVFGAWEDSKYANPIEYDEWFWERAHTNPNDWEDGYPIRNHNVTTVAPTGTTSMIGNTSGGIEPVFSVAYKKNVGNDIQGAEKLVEFDDYFLRALEANDIDVESVKEECAALMNKNEFESVQQLDSIPQELRDLFVTTNDISSIEHGMMQRAFQEKTDSGISKTVNLPKEATHADVHNAYMLALADDKIGAPIKGLTVYRDQSREEQVLTTQEYSDREVERAAEMLEELGYEVEEPN